MRLRFDIQELQPSKILELLRTLEDNLSLENVSVNNLQNWICENPELQDSKHIWYKYNLMAKHFIIKFMKTATHNFLQYFFNLTFSGFLIEKVGLLNTSELFTVGSRTYM